jgi:hypothetical protein
MKILAFANYLAIAMLVGCSSSAPFAGAPMAEKPRAGSSRDSSGSTEILDSHLRNVPCYKYTTGLVKVYFKKKYGVARGPLPGSFTVHALLVRKGSSWSFGEQFRIASGTVKLAGKMSGQGMEHFKGDRCLSFGPASVTYMAGGKSGTATVYFSRRLTMREELQDF